ncbi:MAG TPA: AbrB/MazE/SpoVT family DNA-binding domain-containing protein [Desulfobacterales bacterium]|nr:MAG: AbrB/MazE/SpoVT family DNA-binding domain-containing protein [Deltaproteobacteria bacterium]HDG96690.1 AbrB/MazE/SpoVT family DNA-binding domain-containing protein [Desulfobacterales bacterium]
MLESTITRKGQTTIPKEIRRFLGLRPNDKLFYLIEDDKVILRPIQGDILEVRGAVKPRKMPEDFEYIRKIVKKKIVRRLSEDS